jgi:ribonuclease D
MTAFATPLPHIWVDQDDQLAALCQQWQQIQELAMDTEFIRTDTFFPRPALLQVSDGSACYLLDVLALQDLEPLQKLLAEGPLKVFHSCSEDLEMLAHWLGVLPQPLVDTQLAAAFALQDAGMGYQRLVEELLELKLEKGETRSDWLQRPLTVSQKKYAAQDVEYLLPVWHQLKDKLEQLGWLEAVLEESRWLVMEAQAQSSDQAWLRLKQAWQLNAQQLAVLQALSLWREETARRKDRPRSRVAADALLQALAARQPEQVADLARLEEATPGWVKRYAEEVLEVIARALQLSENEWPQERVSPISKEYKTTRKLLRQALAEEAKELELPQELLARRKQQDAWLQDLLTGQVPEVPEHCPAWRRERLLSVLNRLQVDTP